MPTGMPRPLSMTRTPPSARIVTSMKSAWPASASSTELSTTSWTMWCRPRSPVEPMYMPGRLRTASRPSRTVIALASYDTGASIAAPSGAAMTDSAVCGVPDASSSPGPVDGMFSLGLPESATKRPFWHSSSLDPRRAGMRLRRSVSVSGCWGEARCPAPGWGLRCVSVRPPGEGGANRAQSTASADGNGALPVPEFASAALNRPLSTPHMRPRASGGSQWHSALRGGSVASTCGPGVRGGRSGDPRQEGESPGGRRFPGVAEGAFARREEYGGRGAGGASDGRGSRRRATAAAPGSAGRAPHRTAACTSSHAGGQGPGQGNGQPPVTRTCPRAPCSPGPGAGRTGGRGRRGP